MAKPIHDAPASIHPFIQSGEGQLTLPYFLLAFAVLLGYNDKKSSEVPYEPISHGCA